MIQHRAAPGLALCLLVALCPAAGQAAPHGRGDMAGANAEPSDIITAEIAYARLARDKGLAAAARAAALPDAQIIAFAANGDAPSQPERIAGITKGAAGPSPEWHVLHAWMSCDGTAGVTQGRFQPGNQGYVTVWRRQKRGTYRWALQITGATSGLPGAPAEADMVLAKLADCPARGHQPAAQARPAPADYLSGAADDGTLEWRYTAPDAHTGSFVLRIRQDGGQQVAARLAIVPPAAPAPER